MVSNTVLFTSPDADFSSVPGAFYRQTFFPTYGGSLYAMYLFGSVFPKGDTYDYTRNGRTLTKTGTPALSTGHAAVSATVGYTAPFSAIDLAGNGTQPCSIIAIGSNPLVTATATASLSGGGLGPFTVTNGGSGYNSTVPTVTLSGGTGSGGAATAVISGGQVTGINVTNPGSYTVAPTVTIAAPNGNFIMVNSYSASTAVNMMGVALRDTNSSRFEEAVHHTAGTGRNIGFASAFSPAYTSFRAAAFVSDLEEDLCMRWHPGVSAEATSPNTAQSTIANGGAGYSLGLRNGGSTAATLWGDNTGRLRAVAFYKNKKLTLAEFEDACEQFETRYGQVVGSW